MAGRGWWTAWKWSRADRRGGISMAADPLARLGGGLAIRLGSMECKSRGFLVEILLVAGPQICGAVDHV